MSKTQDANEASDRYAKELAEARRRIAELEASEAEHLRTEEALRASEGRYRSLIENIGIGLTLIDRDHRIIMANAVQGQMFQKATSEFVGKYCFEEFENRDTVCPHCPGIEAMANGRTAIAETKGLFRPARIQAFPVLDADGVTTGFIEVVEDISDLKQAQEALARRAVQLQTSAEVSHATSSILDPNELMEKVVGLIRERFDLYYVGLFMAEQMSAWSGEPGEWAVLRAGTGKAGREMVKQQHKLSVGSQSMIGWCIANKQSRIALDVGEEAVHFGNPLLPDTRSELALPLISRGEVIGALSIQSSQESAFSEEDVAVLQTMAGQIANSLENARLYKQTQAALEELEAAHNSYIRRQWGDFVERQSREK